jgi:DNA-binding MarR family transcriptional regulator
MVAKPDTSLGILLERLSRVVRSAEHEAGLNPAQWEALRYIDRANRFSNSPGALAQFLGATKGTVSQTLIALERKGFIHKQVRADERRSIALSLTRRGRQRLADDPWLRLSHRLDALDQRVLRRLNTHLIDIVRTTLRQGGRPTFGQCSTCRHFGRNLARGDASGPHRCLLLDLALGKSDALKICVEHEPRN